MRLGTVIDRMEGRGRGGLVCVWRQSGALDAAGMRAVVAFPITDEGAPYVATNRQRHFNQHWGLAEGSEDVRAE